MVERIKEQLASLEIGHSTECKRKLVVAYYGLAVRSGVALLCGASNKGSSACTNEIGKCGCGPHAEIELLCKIEQRKLHEIPGTKILLLTHQPCADCFIRLNESMFADMIVWREKADHHNLSGLMYHSKFKYSGHIAGLTEADCDLITEWKDSTIR